MAEDDLLTAEEAQAYLGVSRATFFAFVKRYHVPWYQKPLTGKRHFYRRGDLDAARQTTVQGKQWRQKAHQGGSANSAQRASRSAR
jgi:hypothetical protein